MPASTLRAVPPYHSQPKQNLCHPSLSPQWGGHITTVRTCKGKVPSELNRHWSKATCKSLSQIERITLDHHCNHSTLLGTCHNKHHSDYCSDIRTYSKHSKDKVSVCVWGGGGCPTHISVLNDWLTIASSNNELLQLAVRCRIALKQRNLQKEQRAPSHLGAPTQPQET